MRAVNLLPADARQTTGWRSTAVSERLVAWRQGADGRTLAALAALVLAAAALAFVGISYLGARGDASEREAALAAVDAELQSLPARDSAESVDPALAGDRSPRVAALNSALSRRVAWDRVFRQLSLVLPDDVWLTSLDAGAPADAATAAAPPAAGASEPAACVAPGTVCLKGYTYAHEGVARLLVRLGVVPTLRNVQLQSSAQSLIGERRVYGFTVRAELAQPGASS